MIVALWREIERDAKFIVLRCGTCQRKAVVPLELGNRRPLCCCGAK